MLVGLLIKRKGMSMALRRTICSMAAMAPQQGQRGLRRRSNPIVTVAPPGKKSTWRIRQRVKLKINLSPVIIMWYPPGAMFDPTLLYDNRLCHPIHYILCPKNDGGPIKFTAKERKEHNRDGR